MAELVPHAFSRYKLTPRETLESAILTPLQKIHIQNQLAQVSENILELTYDPQNPLKFAQDDAHLKGQLSALRYLLIASEESELQLSINPTV